MLPEKDLVRVRHMLDSAREIDSIDFEIMWTIICQDIPSLVPKLEKIIKNS